jgi:NADH-quinone oxidoreductase subunit N
MPNLPSLAYFIPELFLLLASLATLLTGTDSRHAQKKINSILGFSLLLTLVAIVFIRPVRPDESHGIFSNLLVWDAFGRFIKLSMILMAGAIFIIILRERRQSPPYPVEFSTIFMIILFATFCLSATNHLIVIFISMQIMNMATFLIIQTDGSSRETFEAAWRDLIFNIVAGLSMLMGTAILYNATGTFFISEIGQLLSRQSGFNFALIFAIILILFGFTHSITGFIRIHWIMNISRAMPVSFRLLLNILPQFAEIAVLIRLANVWFGNYLMVQPMFCILGIFACLMLIYPGFKILKADNPTDIVSLTALSQTGFSLLALSVMRNEGYIAVLFFQMAYILSLIANEAGKFSNGAEKRTVQIVFLASLVGVPLTAGFSAKYLVLTSLMKNHLVNLILMAVGLLGYILMFIGYGRIIRENIQIQTPSFSFPRRGERLVFILRTSIFVLIIWGGLYWTPVTNYLSTVLVFGIP